MQINKINTFTTFKGFDPFNYEKSFNKKAYNEELGKPNVFRDEELYDEDLDKVDDGYKIYDYNDVKLYEPKKDTRLKICREVYGITDLLIPTLDTDVIQGYAVVNTNSDDIEVQNEPILNESYKVLMDACNLKKKNRSPIFSMTLYDNLRRLKKEEGYSYRELAEIAEASKLKRRFIGEYIDTNMVDAVIYCRKNFPQNPNKVTEALVLRNNKGDEVFSRSAFKFLKGAGINDAKKAAAVIKSGVYKNDLGDCMFDKNRCLANANSSYDEETDE